MKKIYIWGIGERTAYYLLMEYFKECDIVGYICSEKNQDSYRNIPVYSIKELMEIQHQVDYIVIANEFYQEIIEACIENNIDLNKIAITDNIPLEPYRTYYKRVENISKDLFEALEKVPFILTRSNEYDLIDDSMCMKQGKYNRSIYMQDYFRYRTFELAANEINDANILGAVAELGVFRGHFSSLINEHFKDRTIYLFDTFEGFDQQEVKKEMTSGRCDERFVKEHKETSVNLMLSNLPYPEKAKVCRGFFPQSISDEARKEKYAFVSLDVDFEDSMLEGLRFFFPRLSDGGMIFIHDYNTYYLAGIKKAVKRYENEIGKRINKVPIADRAGTLIITKD
mgnify:CR=1 FL=1